MTDKPRLVPITDPQEIEALNAGFRGELKGIFGVQIIGAGGKLLHYAEPASLQKWRDWRAMQGHSDSEGEQRE